VPLFLDSPSLPKTFYIYLYANFLNLILNVNIYFEIEERRGGVVLSLVPQSPYTNTTETTSLMLLIGSYRLSIIVIVSTRRNSIWYPRWFTFVGACSAIITDTGSFRTFKNHKHGSSLRLFYQKANYHQWKKHTLRCRHSLWPDLHGRSHSEHLWFSRWRAKWACLAPYRRDTLIADLRKKGILTLHAYMKATMLLITLFNGECSKRPIDVFVDKMGTNLFLTEQDMSGLQFPSAHHFHQGGHMDD